MILVMTFEWLLSFCGIIFGIKLYTSFSLNIGDSKERQELVLQSTVQKKIVSIKRKRNPTLSLFKFVFSLLMSLEFMTLPLLTLTSKFFFISNAISNRSKF